MSLDRGPSIPTGSRGQISMGLVEIAEALACFLASLFGRAYQPALALGLVALRDALALQIHQPEIVLGLAVALLGGRTIPADGHAVVVGHAALAVVVETAQAVLRLGMPLLGSALQPDASLWLAGEILQEHPAQIVLGLRQAGRSRFAEPAHCLRRVLSHSNTVAVHERQIVLGRRLALIGGAPVPDCSLDRVLRHARPLGIEGAQLTRRQRVSLISGLAVPLGCFGHVLRDAATFFVHLA